MTWYLSISHQSLIWIYSRDGKRIGPGCFRGRAWQDSVEEFYSPFSDQLDFAREEMPKIEPKYIPVGRQCPECGGELVQRFGRYGLYIGCTNSPDCKHTERWVERIGVTCPKDGGEIDRTKDKKGKTFLWL